MNEMLEILRNNSEEENKRIWDEGLEAGPWDCSRLAFAQYLLQYSINDIADNQEEAIALLKHHNLEDWDVK